MHEKRDLVPSWHTVLVSSNLDPCGGNLIMSNPVVTEIWIVLDEELTISSETQVSTEDCLNIGTYFNGRNCVVSQPNIEKAWVVADPTHLTCTLKVAILEERDLGSARFTRGRFPPALNLRG